MDPPHAPLPTARNLPFHPDNGNQTSDLMSESDEGLIVSATRQNGGSPAAAALAAAPPAGGLNSPAATAVADVTDVFGNRSDAARCSQAAGVGGASCESAMAGLSRTSRAAATVLMPAILTPNR